MYFKLNIELEVFIRIFRVYKRLIDRRSAYHRCAGRRRNRNR